LESSFISNKSKFLFRYSNIHIGTDLGSKQEIKNMVYSVSSLFAPKLHPNLEERRLGSKDRGACVFGGGQKMDRKPFPFRVGAIIMVVSMVFGACQSSPATNRCTNTDKN
jgi:hypothetical protein